jgi:hypothetical protein
MTDRELDALMQRVLLDSLRLDWEKKAAPEPAFVPSARYKRQVAGMLADPLAWERKRRIPIWKSIVRQAAVVLLIISLGFGSLLAASPTVRAGFLQWIAEWYETHVTYRYTGTDMAGAMPQYEITELPEGYAEVESERIELPGQVDIVYRNEETGKTIYLNYIHMNQGAASDFKLEDAEVLSVMVNKFDGHFFERSNSKNKWNAVTWIDPDNELQFSIEAHLDKTDILDIAESVFLVKLTK